MNQYFGKTTKGNIIFVTCKKTDKNTGVLFTYGINLASPNLRIKTYRATNIVFVEDPKEIKTKLRSKEFYNLMGDNKYHSAKISQEYFQKITEIIEAISTVPFHKAVIEVIKNASTNDLSLLATLIKMTRIPGDYQKIKECWQKRTEEMACEDFGIIKSLRIQEKYCAKK